MGKRVERTRNGKTLTEAAFWGMIRSTLRRRTMYWLPIKQAREQARRPYKGNNKRQKWEFLCAECKKHHPQKNINVDHKIEAGSLRNGDDLKGFVERLFCEDVEGYQVLCKPCHKSKTHKK
jgi:hypothetical protein